jgi:hypothetical protein
MPGQVLCACPHSLFIDGNTLDRSVFQGGTRFFGQLQHPLHKVRHVKFDPIAGKTQFPGLMVSAVNSLSGSTGFIENSFAAISHGRLNMFRVITRTSFGSQMRPVSPGMKEGAS